MAQSFKFLRVEGFEGGMDVKPYYPKRPPMFAIDHARFRARGTGNPFADIIQHEIRAHVREMHLDLGRQFWIPLFRDRPLCSYGMLSRLHVWGKAIRVPPRECSSCHGRMEFETDDYGWELCHECIAGIIPGYSYRECQHCHVTQSTQSR